MSDRKTVNAVTLGLFSAITVIMQMLGYTVKIGTFSLSLVLVPIVVSAVLYGPKFSAIIGAVFGAVTVIGTVTGIDPGAYVLFSASPVITILLCMIKGTLCGLSAGLISASLKNKSKSLGVLLAAITAPVVNTGIFIITMIVFFRDTLSVWAAGTDIIYYAIFGLTGVNFLIELAVNLLLSSAVVRIVSVIKKGN